MTFRKKACWAHTSAPSFKYNPERIALGVSICGNLLIYPCLTLGTSLGGADSLAATNHISDPDNSAAHDIGAQAAAMN